MTVQLEVVSPLKLLEQDLDSVMADQQFTDSGSSPGSSSDCAVHGPGSASETSMWEEWTQATNSAVGDEVSTSNFFSDLTTSNSTSSRLSFQQSDMLSTWMSSFHPLTPTTDPIDQCQPSFMQHDLDHPIDAADALPLVYESKTTGVSRQLLRALGPLSPSSPLAIHNGLLNPLCDPWDGQWTSARGSTFFLDHSASAVEHLEDITPKPRHTDVFMGPNGTFESATPGGWTPQLLFDRTEEVKPVAPMKLMASLREAGEVTSCAGPREIGSLVDLRSKEDSSCVATNSSSAVTMAGMLADCQRRPLIADIDSTMMTTWPRKHRLELLELVDAESDQPLLKRAKTVNSVEETKLLQSWCDIQTYCSASGVAGLASQAMDIIAIGPALNTNGKPRARRGSATDPQSVYARHRREKINERLKNLQNLVPNGAKVDIVTMLDEAIHYVKFLQNQVELLKSDDYWMYATPNNYNGMDLSELSQELEPSA